VWRKSSHSNGTNCVEADSWRKSSRSAFNGSCVEALAWRKSTASESNGDCVEAGQGADVTVVRDSQDPDGAWLTVTPAAWRAFTARLKTATA